MNLSVIPHKLQHLIPMVEKWGIEDDGFRDQAVYNATTNELTEIVSSVSDEDALIIDAWFCDSRELSNPSEEYIRFSAFFMAFEYAKALLEGRS